MVASIIAQSAGQYIVRSDEGSGLLEVDILGWIDEKNSHDCFAALDRAWTSARRRHGRVLLRVDASQAQVQPPALLESMRNAGNNKAMMGDRIAFIVQSSLVKMQYRRAVVEAGAAVSFFMSPNAADTWLTADGMHSRDSAA